MNIRKKTLVAIVGLFVIFYAIISYTKTFTIVKKLVSTVRGNPPNCFDACLQTPSSWGDRKLAIIVPYRGAFEELIVFAPYLHKFLNEHKTRHEIFIINQVDSYRFNRGALINVGVLLTEESFDYFAIHDIDLLPINQYLEYKYPAKGPYHLSPGDYHPLSHGQLFFSGVLLFTYQQFRQVRGMTNKKWGWGGEDCELRSRVVQGKLEIQRPYGLTSGYNTFLNIHDESKRPRDKARKHSDPDVNNYVIDRDSGIDTVKFSKQSQVQMVIEGAPVTVFNVKLMCSPAKTPWCDPDFNG